MISPQSHRFVSAFLRCAALFLAALAPTALAQNYTFSTYAGATLVTGSTDDTGTAARFNKPSGVAIDGAGNLYVADRLNRIIRKITPGGAVTTLAGTAGVSGHLDGTGSAAQFMLPTALAVDGAGNVYVADQGAHLIRKITPAGVVTTLAGTGGTAGSVDGTGSAALFRTPSAIAVNAAGDTIYVGDSQNHVIRKITAAGVVTLFAGAFQTPGSVDATGTAARLRYPAGLALDGAGTLYVSDGSNNQIRQITAAGVVTTIAGSAADPAGSTDGTGTAARFNFPAGIAFDNTSGALIVADEGNSTLRKVTLTGVVTTLGGSPGVLGSDDGAGSVARFRFVNGIAVDAAGSIFAADEGNSTIRLGLPDAPRLIAMSQRANSTGADGALLASFAIEGSAAKKVLIRAIGPALAGAPFNVSGAMQDPFLAIYNSAGTPLGTNNDWTNNTTMTDAFAAVGAFALAAGSKDAALLTILNPGNYTVRITGVGGTSGIALLELYDVHEGQRIAYASNRATVAAGGTNITSFALGGPGTAGTRQVLIRAVGAGLGIAGALADPTITLKTVTGTTIGSNDNWGTHPHQTQLATATAAAGAMPLASSDSALLVTLPVGIYNVETTGVGGTGGVALTEIHTLGPDRPLAIAPALLVPLHDQTLAAGSNIMLTAPFLARPAPTFQWQRNSVDLAGQTNATLAITNLSTANAGAYRVLLTNASATTTSAIAQFKLLQTITFPEIASRQYVFGSTFTLDATASSGLPIIYASSNTDVATVSGNTVTIHDVGTTTITALQTGDSTYGSASLAREFIVTKRAITLTLGNLTHVFDGSAKSATVTLDPDVPATVNFTYNGNATPPSAVGSYTVAATISSIHYEGTTTGTLVIGKAPQTITFAAIDNRVFAPSSSFTVNPTSSASLPVSLASSNTDVATVNGNTISIVGGGTVTITATQAGNASFNAAPAVARTFTVTPASATVTLGSLSHTYNGSVKGATATTDPVGLNLSFTYTGTASATTAPTNAGSYGVTATVVSNSYAGSATGTIVIAKAPQTITFPSLPTRAIDQGNFSLVAPLVSVDSGLSLTFTSGTPAVASISGNTVTLHTTGATLITASQAGNDNYLAATSVQQNLVVLAASQTITFTQSLAKTFGNAPFDLTATASSGLSVSYASSNTAVATISGSTVTIVGAGESTITASQAGNASFAAAPNVARTLTVAKGAATVTLGGLAATYNGSPRAATATTAPVAGLSVIFNYTPGGATAPTAVGSYQVTGTIDDANYAGTASGTLVIAKAPQTITFATLAPRLINAAPFTLGATADSGLTVTYTSSNPGVATVSGNTVTIAGLGTTTITAKQAGDANYLAAADLPRTLTVNPVAPVIVSAPPATANAVRGRPFLYGPITLNPLSAPVTFSATGLPAGLSVNATNGHLTGTPTAEGTANITITATNATGTANHLLALTVQPPAPVITSAAAATGVAGSVFSYTIVAAGATSFSATGLPEWLTLNGTSGALSGTPPAAGSFTVQITATNATGSAVQPLAIGITAPANAPVYAGTLTPSGTVGVAFTFTPNFGAGTGTTYALTGTLPTGISFSSTTGALTGMPTQAGTFALALAATRSGVTATANLTLTINPAATAPVVTITGGNVRSGAVGAVFGPVALSATPAATSFTIGTLPAGLTVGGTAAAPTIGGTPTSPGTTSVQISATAGGLTGPIATLLISIAPHASAPVVTSSPIVHGRVGEPLTYTLTATPAATTWGMSGALPLPGGLTFDGDAGTVTGTPTGAMTRRLFFAGTNASGIGIALEVTFVIAPRTTVPVVNSNATAAGQVGQPFNYVITATNSPTSFGTTTLPAGLSLNGTTGVISGVPSTATPPDTPALVMLGATNADGTSLPKQLRITIAPAAATPIITSSATASARVGVAFTYQISASESPTSFVATNLPAGLSVNPATGAITGTPAVSGPFVASIAAANASGLGAAAPLALHVAPALTAPAITSAAATSGQVGVFFTYQIVATPGTITNYALTGSLPAGLALNTASGTISGHPTQPGFFNVSLTATSDGGTSLPQPLSIHISPAAGVPIITSAGEATATVGGSFTYTIQATNSPTSRDAVNLPDGLAVNPYTGVIFGTPTTAGTSGVWMVAANSSGTGPARQLIIRVLPPGGAPAIFGPTLYPLQVGVAFGSQLSATNSPTSFEVHGAPAWLLVNNANGLISGTPTAPGEFPVAFQASNSAGASALYPATIIVAAAFGTPVITSSRTAAGTVGAVFPGYTLTASGSPTSYLALGLPPGLALNPTTGAITGTPTASGTYPVIVSATNATGPGTPVTVTFSIGRSITFGL